MNDGKEKRTDPRNGEPSIFDAWEERRTRAGEGVNRETPEGDCTSRGEETLEGLRTGIGRKEKNGFIYFIATENAEVVKIGFSVRPAMRLWGLRTASPFQLRLIGFLPGTHRTERMFHRRFAEDRMHGEWFRNSDSVRAFIEGIGLIRPDEEESDDWQPAEEPAFVDWFPGPDKIDDPVVPKRIRKINTSGEKNPHAVALGRLGGLRGGNARAEALTAEEMSAIGRKGGLKGGAARTLALSPAKRRAIARKGAEARWGKKDGAE
jgi:Meiotically up-regulated gene 113